MSTLITEEDKQQFLEANVYVTDEQIEHAKNVAQKSDDWHRYRNHRIGMSSAGAAAGHGYDSASQAEALQRMLWPSTFAGNDATEYGNIMEDTGLSVMQIVIKDHFAQLGYGDLWVQSTGTWIWKEHPWLSASSDGLIYAIDGPEDRPSVFGTAENKAPYKMEAYPHTPHYYYDQFQGTAIIVNADFIIFNVYTPSATHVCWFDVDRDYWMKEVFPKLEDFYMNTYLPRAILKERGLLHEGEVDIKPIITVSLPMFKRKTPADVAKDEKAKVRRAKKQKRIDQT